MMPRFARHKILLSIALFSLWAYPVLSDARERGTSTARLLFFHAQWCKPCRECEPMVDELIADGYAVEKIDVVRRADVRLQHQVDVLPTFVVIDRGHETGRIVGTTSREYLLALLGGEQRERSTARPPAAVARIRNQLADRWYMGSGTLVDRDARRGVVLSCYHIFGQGIGQVTVTFSNGQTYAAAMLTRDPAHDLSAWTIAAPPITPIQVSAELPQPGELLTSAGFGQEGVYWANHGRLTEFLVCKETGAEGFFEISGPARQGDSGGPITNERGELCGVVEATGPDQPTKQARTVGADCRQVAAMLGPWCPQYRRPQPRPSRPLQKQPERKTDVPPAGSVPTIPLPGNEQAAPDNSLLDKLRGDFEALQREHAGLLDKLKGLRSDNERLADHVRAKDGIVEELQARRDELKAQLAAAAEAAKEKLPDLAKGVVAGGGAKAIEGAAEKAAATGLTAVLIGLGLSTGPAGWLATAITGLAFTGAGALTHRLWTRRSTTSPNGGAAGQPPVPFQDDGSATEGAEEKQDEEHDDDDEPAEAGSVCDDSSPLVRSREFGQQLTEQKINEGRDPVLAATKGFVYDEAIEQRLLEERDPLAKSVIQSLRLEVLERLHNIHPLAIPSVDKPKQEK